MKCSSAHIYSQKRDTKQAAAAPLFLLLNSARALVSPPFCAVGYLHWERYIYIADRRRLLLLLCNINSVELTFAFSTVNRNKNGPPPLSFFSLFRSYQSRRREKSYCATVAQAAVLCMTSSWFFFSFNFFLASSCGNCPGVRTEARDFQSEAKRNFEIKKWRWRMFLLKRKKNRLTIAEQLIEGKERERKKTDDANELSGRRLKWRKGR